MYLAVSASKKETPYWMLCVGLMNEPAVLDLDNGDRFYL
jgi:hypothetical protein